MVCRPDAQAKIKVQWRFWIRTRCFLAQENTSRQLADVLYFPRKHGYLVTYAIVEPVFNGLGVAGKEEAILEGEDTVSGQVLTQDKFVPGLNGAVGQAVYQSGPALGQGKLYIRLYSHAKREYFSFQE